MAKYITCYVKDKDGDYIAREIPEDCLDLSEHDAELIEKIRDEIIRSPYAIVLKVFDEAVEGLNDCN